MRNMPLTPKVYKNFTSAAHSGKTEYPPAGMGFIYKIVIQRAGRIGDATYIGMTTRSLSSREADHFRAARKLGVLNPTGMTNGEKILGYQGDNMLYPVMRTAMGTRQTRNDRLTTSPYFKMEVVGLTSLHGIQTAETLLIKQDQSENSFNKPNTLNYHNIRHSGNLNVKEGGEGFSWRNFPSSEKAISAYIYLRDESPVRYGPKDKDKFIDELVRLTYGKGGGRKRENVIHYVKTYLGYGDAINANIAGKNFRSRTAMSATIAAIMRPQGKASYGGFSGDQMRDNLNKLSGMELSDDAVWLDYLGQPVIGMQAIDVITKEIGNQVVKAVMDDVYQQIKDGFKKN